MKTVGKIALAIVFPALMLMTACSSAYDDTAPKSNLDDGGTIYREAGVNDNEARKIIVDGTPCIIWDGGTEGGISCGWNATDPTATDVR